MRTLRHCRRMVARWYLACRRPTPRILLVFVVLAVGCSDAESPTADAPKDDTPSTTPATGARAEADKVVPHRERKAERRATFIAADFCAGVMLLPSGLLDIGIVPDELMAILLSGVDLTETRLTGLKDVESVSVFIDPTPGGNVLFLPGGVVRFAGPVDLSKLLHNNWPDIREQEFVGKTYFTSYEFGMADVAMAAFAADNRTLLIGPEPTLQKMLIADNVKTPFATRWNETDFAADVNVLLSVDPIRNLVGELVSDFGSTAEGRQVFDHAPALVDFVTASMRVSGRDLLTLTVHPQSADSFGEVVQMAGAALVLVKNSLRQIRSGLAEELPEDLAASVDGALAELEQGIRVDRTEESVSLVVKRPSQLDDVLANGALLFGLAATDSEVPESDVAAAQIPDGWKIVTANDGSCRAAFPDDPLDTTDESGGTLRHVDDNSGLEILVAHSPAQMELTADVVDALFESERDFLTSDGEKLVRQRRLKQNGFPVSEFVVESTEGIVTHYRAYVTPVGGFTVSLKGRRRCRGGSLRFVCHAEGGERRPGHANGRARRSVEAVHFRGAGFPHRVSC